MPTMMPFDIKYRAYREIMNQNSTNLVVDWAYNILLGVHKNKII